MITKTYKTRYYCETDAKYFYLDQTPVDPAIPVLPATCPNGHTNTIPSPNILRDLVILKETIEIT